MSKLVRENTALATLFARPGWLRRLRWPPWGEPAYERHRRESRLFLMGPLGAVGGFAAGVASAAAVGFPLVVWAPLAATAGFGVMWLATHLETFIRIRRSAGVGWPARAVELAVDALGGGLIGGVLGTALDADTGVALAAGATIFAFASSMRRIFMGNWIGDTIRFLSSDVLTEQAPDYSLEQTLLAEGRVEEAVERFEELSRAQGGRPAPLVDAAQMLRSRGRYRHAIEMYAKAMDAPDLDVRRASVFAQQILDICRRNLGSAAPAVVHLETLVERYPDAPEVEWAWKELTVGMTVSQAEADHLGAHSAHVPAVKAVERILSEAFVARASDIHLEDYAGQLRVRYRVDGMLQDAESPPARIRSAVLARVRVMAGLNPAESPVPQDARLRIPFAGREVDVRVSTVPTLHGESIALRILDTDQGTLELEDLGFREGDMGRLLSAVTRPNGMVLTTGPGGSGKSTTLHAIVRKISTGREKIFTVEDPVEYGLDGVCQVSVNHKAGLTFARLLRSLVRQDPDVLLVGEIRDTETAEIATHASLTGHLVLSTLHTTDAVSALHRLVDIGVPDYMVVHTLEAAIAQRLVRRVCGHCARDVAVTDVEAGLLGNGEAPTHFVQGEGCDRCRGTGYKGRIGLYELMLVDEDMRQAFLRRAPRRELEVLARAGGMWSLREDGVHKIRHGITTPEEVMRVTTAS